MIINSSDEEIIVEYELKKPEFEYQTYVYLPKRTTLENLNAWRFFQKDLEKMPLDRYSFDKDTRIFKIRVAPYEVISIEQMEWGAALEEKNENFKVKTLKISGKNKEILFGEDKKLLQEFRKHDFQIFYK